MIDETPALESALQRGRLVLFLATAPSAGVRVPPTLCLTMDRSFVPDSQLVCTAREIEEGSVRRVTAGTIVEIGAWEAFGTPRHPTRLRAWMEQILRHRLVLFLVGPMEQESVQRLLRSFGGPHCVVVNTEQAEAVLQRLAASGYRSPKHPPPLPAVASRVGLALLSLAAAISAVWWLLLYVWHDGAQNWPWVRLVPGAVVLATVAVMLLPLLGRMLAGQEVSVTECYARALARWSRGLRAVGVLAAFGSVTLIPWGIFRIYLPATFLVMYESAGVSFGGYGVGACKAEEPCTLIVSRGSHLHFEGAEGDCGLDLPEEQRLILIDLQSDGCEPPLEETPAPPRG